MEVIDELIKSINNDIVKKLYDSNIIEKYMKYKDEDWEDLYKSMEGDVINTYELIREQEKQKFLELYGDFNDVKYFEEYDLTAEEKTLLKKKKSSIDKTLTKLNKDENYYPTRTFNDEIENLYNQLIQKPIKGKGYRKKLIFGRGYEKVKKNLAQINKYYIDLDALNKNVLKLKYVKNRNIVPNCPIQRGISDDVKNMIIDITENNFYKEKYNKLSERDKQIFIDFCNSAHLDVGISLDKTNEDEKQLNILYGAYMAGNKDEKIITQIKKLLSKAMKLNKISSKQAISILEDLE